MFSVKMFSGNFWIEVLPPLLLFKLSSARYTNSHEYNDYKEDSCERYSNSENCYSNDDTDLMKLYDGSRCARDCDYSKPQKCYFRLEVEDGNTMGP